MAAETQGDMRAMAEARLKSLQHQVDAAIAGRRPMVHVNTNDQALLLMLASKALGASWAPRMPGGGTQAT